MANPPAWFDKSINECYTSYKDNYNFRSKCGHIVNTRADTFKLRFADKCSECKQKDSIPDWFNEINHLNPDGYNGSEEKYYFECVECKKLMYTTYGNYIHNYNKTCCKTTTVAVPSEFNEIAHLNPEGYTGSKSKYTFISDCGHTYISRWDDRKRQKHKCNTCSSKEYFDTCNTPTWFEYSIETEYKGSNREYVFKCTGCDNEFSMIPNNYLKNFYGTNECPDCRTYEVSNLEHSMIEYLDTLGVEYKHSQWNIIPNKEIDFYIDSHQLAIEMNGVYWHSEKFKNYRYHLDKTNHAENLGINLLHINEDEWMNPYKREIWKSMISGKLGLNHKIGARKTKVVEVQLKHAQDFINANHLQGYAGAKYKLGLEFQGKLIAVMTFSKSRYSNQDAWEIVRFSSLVGYNIIRGFSKILSYFNTTYNTERLNILSYADRRHSQGNVYKKNGFKFSHFSKPNYKYFRGSYLMMEPREKYMKHKLPDLLETFDPNLTEYENMKLNGYERIWDSGNSVWILEYA